MAIERASFPDNPWRLEDFLSEMERSFTVLLGVFPPDPASKPGRPGAPALAADPRFGSGPPPIAPAGPALVAPPAGYPGAVPEAPARPALQPATGLPRAGPASYAVFWILCGETHLLNLAVSPACRGRGLGRATLRTVIRLSRAKGSGKVMLEAREDNVPAVNLYLSEGFRTVGKRRGYYGGGKTDALSMTLILE